MRLDEIKATHARATFELMTVFPPTWEGVCAIRQQIDNASLVNDVPMDFLTGIVGVGQNGTVLAIRTNISLMPQEDTGFSAAFICGPLVSLAIRNASGQTYYSFYAEGSTSLISGKSVQDITDGGMFRSRERETKLFIATATETLEVHGPARSFADQAMARLRVVKGMHKTRSSGDLFGAVDEFTHL